jgi:hypothetical protein
MDPRRQCNSILLATGSFRGEDVTHAWPINNGKFCWASRKDFIPKVKEITRGKPPF